MSSNNINYICLKEIIDKANTGADAIKRAPIVEEDTGVRCLRIGDISNDRPFEEWGFTNADTGVISKFELKKNDILVARTGNTIGVVKYIKNDLKSVYNNGLIRLKVSSNYHPKYIYYNLISEQFKNFIYGISAGTSTQPNMKIDHMLQYPVMNVGIEEQKAIANILSSLDEKIELNNQMNKTLEEMAQTLFKRWFVEFEFPNEYGEPYKSSGGEMVDSELGMIPKGYLISTLDEMCNLSVGGDKPKTFSKLRSEECNIPIYSNGIENEGLYGFTDKAKIFEKSVTVSARRTIGFICLRQGPYVPIVRLISVIPSKCDLSSEYLYHWLRGMNIQATGTTQQQLTVPQFKKSNILIPTTNIMKNFTMKVGSMVAQMEANKLENENLSSIRDALLPKLMSGEIRVTDLQN